MTKCLNKIRIHAGSMVMVDMNLFFLEYTNQSHTFNPQNVNETFECFYIDDDIRMNTHTGLY